MIDGAIVHHCCADRHGTMWHCRSLARLLDWIRQRNELLATIDQVQSRPYQTTYPLGCEVPRGD